MYLITVKNIGTIKNGCLTKINSFSKMERNRKAIKTIKFVPYNIHHINIYGVY
ncbi:hypothetical protein BVAVS116_E0034 (plasmid) [Borreliella valaisiana VS116]|uniref:Uncharacterized protein n=1 Tax=Borreliella valaisiana VS116 TaxID=445987 RepID=C0R8R5_BORVA|nr:hypothetical protein BVAVS116_E0034 [Borreliella valaisiana VS116]